MDNNFSHILFNRIKALVLIAIIFISILPTIQNYSDSYKASATITTKTITTTTNKTNINSDTNTTTNTAAAADSQSSNTKEFALIAEEATINISPNKKIKAWTYNGTIPGPTLRVTEGDRVIVNFINKLDLPHTIHFHGGHNGTMDGVFEIVAPNKTFTYDFIATPSGALMYHCHVMPVVEHVRMGLYGAFIVDPKIPLTPAKEFVLVFGDYDTRDIHTADPESTFYNGYENLYHNNPLKVYTNETARVYLINLSQLPAYGWHLHGTLFKTWISGILQNDPVYTQTWATSSGDAAIFEMKWPWTGKFVFHAHGIPEDRGAMGYFNVTNPSKDLIDGKDIALTKSISMIEWQENLTKSLQNNTN